MAKKQPPADPTPDADNISSLQLQLPDEPAPEPESNDPVQEVAEAAPVAGADEPSLIPTVASTMRQWGYEVADDATEDDIRSHLEELEDRASKYEANQKELEQLRQWRALQEQQRSDTTPAPTPKPDEAVAQDDDDLGIPDPPKLDTYALQMLRVAESAGKLERGLGGVLTSEDVSLQQHIAKYNQWLSEKEAYDAEWGDNRKVAKHVAQRYAEKAKAEAEAVRKEFNDWKSQQQQSSVQSAIDAYFIQNKEAYFDLGPDGNPVWDEQTQTYRGARYAEYIAAVQEAMDLGATDQVKIHRYAAKKVPPVAPAAAAPPEAPAKKTVKFHNRLRNNGSATLNTAPVNRPAASAAARDTSKLSTNQQLSALLPDLLSRKVADRM